MASRTLAVMPPDFFNSREDVLMIYGAVFIAFAIKVAPGQVLSTMRAALSPPLVRVFALALLPPAAFVFLAYRMGWWHTTTLKETIYWFTGTGIILVGMRSPARHRRASISFQESCLASSA